MTRQWWCVALWLIATACDSGGLFTKVVPLPAMSLGTTVQFPLGSDYPANVLVPDIDGMRDTAFVVSLDSPSGLVAIDLTGETLQLSATFAGCLVPTGSGLPAGPMFFLSAQRALFLTSSHLIDCNPTTGTIRATLALTEPIQLSSAAPLSRPYDTDGNGTIETAVVRITPSYPGGLARSGSSLFVSFGNYLLPTGDVVAAPGVILEYRLLDQPPYLARGARAPFVTTAFNPTALRVLPDGRLLVVESGVNTIVNSATQPVTTSGVELVDLTRNTRQFIDAGPVALAFQPPAVTADGRRAFLTSAAYGEVYALDLESGTWVRDHGHPIVMTADRVAHDFLPQAVLDPTDQYLFVGSFSQSAVSVVRVGADDFVVAPSEYPDPWQVGHPAGVTTANPSGANTGVGSLTYRPGALSAEAAARSLLVLTASPGTLLTIDARPHVVTPSLLKPPTVTPSVSVTSPSSTSPHDLAESGADDPDTDDGRDVTDDDTTDVEEEEEEEETTPPTPTPSPVTPAPKKPKTPSVPTPKPAPAPVVIRVEADDERAFVDDVVKLTPSCETTSHFGCNDFPEIVLGAPRGAGAKAGSMHVLSLGCKGEIIVEMEDLWIADGAGPDFIVFENPFEYGTETFAEPGRVAVSKDGITFVEFPCAGASEGYAGCAGLQPVLSHPDNGIDPTDPDEAGGDAFDLADVGLSYARYVRIRDKTCATGTTPNAGFDLDAISIIWGREP